MLQELLQNVGIIVGEPEASNIQSDEDEEESKPKVQKVISTKKIMRKGRRGKRKSSKNFS